jgi:hypothetical protein
MRVRSLLLCAALSWSCAHGSLDRGESLGAHAPGIDVADVPVRGFQVNIDAANGSFSGELFAVDDQFVYVNTGRSEQEWNGERIPRAFIKEVEVDLYSSDSLFTGVWTGLGTASTLSHGAFLIFSGPIWLATGIPVSVNESSASHATAGPDELSKLYQFARFPQGLPGRRGKPHLRPAGPAAPGVPHHD